MKHSSNCFCDTCLARNCHANIRFNQEFHYQIFAHARNIQIKRNILIPQIWYNYITKAACVSCCYEWSKKFSNSLWHSCCQLPTRGADASLVPLNQVLRILLVFFCYECFLCFSFSPPCIAFGNMAHVMFTLIWSLKIKYRSWTWKWSQTFYVYFLIYFTLFLIIV